MLPFWTFVKYYNHPHLLLILYFAYVNLPVVGSWTVALFSWKWLKISNLNKARFTINMPWNFMQNYDPPQYCKIPLHIYWYPHSTEHPPLLMLWYPSAVLMISPQQYKTSSSTVLKILRCADCNPPRVLNTLQCTSGILPEYWRFPLNSHQWTKDTLS